MFLLSLVTVNKLKFSDKLHGHILKMFNTITKTELNIQGKKLNPCISKLWGTVEVPSSDTYWQ